MALYDDIGGAPMVRAVLDAFYPRVLSDPMLSRFFLGVDIERLKTIQEGFFASALGGPTVYTGRRLDDAHVRAQRRGLNGKGFDRFVTVFEEVLIDLRVHEAGIGEWLAVLRDARSQVLDR